MNEPLSCLFHRTKRHWSSVWIYGVDTPMLCELRLLSCTDSVLPHTDPINSHRNFQSLRINQYTDPVTTYRPHHHSQICHYSQTPSPLIGPITTQALSPLTDPITTHRNCHRTQELSPHKDPITMQALSPFRPCHHTQTPSPLTEIVNHSDSNTQTPSQLISPITT